MGKVSTGMSLDGFIAGPNDGPERPLGEGGERLFEWYSAGDTEYGLPGTEMVFRVSLASAELLREAHSKMGAFVTGRRTFDLTHGWGGRPPLGVPAFVVTHTVPQEWVYGGSPFTFVTDGVKSAVEKAREAVGDKDVAVGAASIAQQCIEAGLLDEIHVELERQDRQRITGIEVIGHERLLGAWQGDKVVFPQQYGRHPRLCVPSGGRHPRDLGWGEGFPGLLRGHVQRRRHPDLRLALSGRRRLRGCLDQGRVTTNLVAPVGLTVMFE